MDAMGDAQLLYARSGAGTTDPNRPPAYKAVGLTLAIASGLFIGTSFVLKKTGLLRANAKYNEEAGEGYGYLKNAYWWTGMTLMIIGEICNFVAYAFVDAILVTPLGALSVVITTILSAIFLKERLSFVGKVGCFNCIIGSVVIVMNAPQQSSVADIQEMKHFVISPGFLSYAGVVILVCAFIALWAGPRYGKKSMLVYLSICSLIGGLSVVATQGLGSAIVAQAGGKPQFNQWFLYLLLVFVVATLLTEIIYLNKALNLFNAALVTPTYYVFFTSATIVTSAILFRGFKGTPIGIATVIMGFLQICAGVVLLQLSKSAKDVPDAAVFKGDVDQVRTIAEQEQPETEPKADAIRGAAAIIRRISVSRQKMEQEEARRYHDEKMRDQMEPIAENEIVEWDGLRRRKTVIGESPIVPLQRRKTLHPPLGMSHFPEDSTQEEDQRRSEDDQQESHGFFESARNRAKSVLLPSHRGSLREVPPHVRSPMHPVALTEISVAPAKAVDSPTQAYSQDEGQEHVYGLPAGLRPLPQERSGTGSPRTVPWGRNRADSSSQLAPTPPPHATRRQFSFQNVFHRARSDEAVRLASGVQNLVQSSPHLPAPNRMGLGSRQGSKEHASVVKDATEEERLGLVKGDSHAMFHDAQHHHSTSTSSPPKAHHRYSSSEDADIVDDYDYRDDGSEEDWQIENRPPPRMPTHQQHPHAKPLPPIATALPPSSSTRSGSASAGQAPGPGLPAHPAVNVQITSSPDREPHGLRRVGVDHTTVENEYYDDHEASRRGWDQQGQQQQQQQQNLYQQQQQQHRDQERNITGTGRGNGRRKPRREGSDGSSSSVEDREIRDYEARSGRRGGDGAFI